MKKDITNKNEDMIMYVENLVSDAIFKKPWKEISKKDINNHNICQTCGYNLIDCTCYTSTNIHRAWKIIQKMKQDGYNTIIEYDSDSIYVSIGNYSYSIDCSDDEDINEGLLCFTICAVALAVIGIYITPHICKNTKDIENEYC